MTAENETIEWVDQLREIHMPLGLAKRKPKKEFGGTDELTEVGGGCIGPAEVGDLFRFFLCFWSNKDCHCVQE